MQCAGIIFDAYTNVADVVPTFLDLPHLPPAKQTFEGHAVLPF
jgi:arylsulfatase A-like enzyme